MLSTLKWEQVPLWDLLPICKMNHLSKSLVKNSGRRWLLHPDLTVCWVRVLEATCEPLKSGACGGQEPVLSAGVLVQGDVWQRAHLTPWDAGHICKGDCKLKYKQHNPLVGCEHPVNGVKGVGHVVAGAGNLPSGPSCSGFGAQALHQMPGGSGHCSNSAHCGTLLSCLPVAD